MPNGQDLERGGSSISRLGQPKLVLTKDKEDHASEKDDHLEPLGKWHSKSNDNLKLSWRIRIKHFTWTWFTLTMATGGLAAVIYNVPQEFHFRGLYEIGCFFMLLNIVLFIFNCVCMITRFVLWPQTLRASFLHPTESLFAPAVVISLCVILTNITQYGLKGRGVGDWLTVTMAVLYWCYLGMALAFSSGIYLLIWSTQSFTISQMTPVWIFPAYPLLLAGPFAGVLSHPETGRVGASAIRIIVSGVIIQGIGFMVSLMVYSAYLYRLMTQKLPAESLRPGMFISIGPSGFTITALISMAHNFAQVVPEWDPNFMGNGHLAGVVTKVLANWVGIWLWGLAIWFLFVSIGAHYSCVSHGRMTFQMTWNSFIFPNTALAMATFSVAKALDGNRPINILGCIMAVALVLAWLFIIGMAIRAVVLKQILWPQKQEDRDVDQRHQELSRRRIAATNPPLLTPLGDGTEPTFGMSSRTTGTSP